MSDPLPSVGCMTGVCIIDDFEVTAAQRRDLEALRALQVEKARLVAREHELLVSIAGAHMQVLSPKGLELQVHIADPIRSEICIATGWSERFAASQLHVARTLATTLPLTAAALAAGTLGEAHARMIVATMDRFDVTSSEDLDRLAVRLEARVLPNTLDRTKPMTLAGLRGICNRAVAAIDPKGALLRAKKARDGFDVWVYDDGDGVSELRARMSSLAAHACMRKLDAMVAQARAALGEATPAVADMTHVEAVTAGQWRADALETLILGTSVGMDADDVHAPSATAPVQARVDVVIDLNTLLGLRDGMVTLNGTSEVPAEDVRDLLVGPDADVMLRRLVTDPLTGQLLDVGRSSYVPSGRLKDFIIIRDGRCRFPGCTRRAANADIDHAVAWNQHGETSRANLGALCRRHHLLKTHAGYNITQSETDGTCTWHTPSGATIEHAPVPVMPFAEPDEPDDPPF